MTSLTEDIINVTFDNNVKDFYCDIQGRAKYVSTDIKVGDLRISLLRILHPQIINGIKIKPNNNINIKGGIFMDNINPKEFKIKKLDCVKNVSPSTDKSYNFKRNEKWAVLDTKICNTVNV